MRRSIITPTLVFCSVACSGLGLFQTGCSVLSPKADNTKLYILRTKSAPSAATAQSKVVKPAVRVGPGRLAAYLDVTPVVVQDGPNRVKELDLHHWAEPLSKGISRVFSENLVARLNGTQIIVYPEPANAAALELRYTINRLEGTLGGPVVLQVNWQMVDSASAEVVRAASTDREIAAVSRTGDVSAYVEQISVAIGNWADEVAAAIRALPTGR